MVANQPLRSPEIDDFFDMDTPANKAVTAIPGRDVEGTIGGNPEFDGESQLLGVVSY